MIHNAGVVIHAISPPERINTSPDSFACKFCHHNAVCHEQKLPEINCRTCDHSFPCNNGNWQCALHDKELTPEEQLKGCKEHKYQLHFVPEKKLSAYERYASQELKTLPDSMLNDPIVDGLIKDFGAKIISSTHSPIKSL